MKYQTRPSAFGLLPAVIFLLLIGLLGFVADSPTRIPLLVAFMIAGGVAIVFNPPGRRLALATKVDSFVRGAGEPTILLLCAIFLLAGAFQEVARATGAVDATVAIGMAMLPDRLLLAGIFLVACFISFSMGTSMGTVVTLTPLSVGIAAQTDLSLALAVGSVLGGAMFGDNLSFVSDTTIAAVRTQGCGMRDKCKANAWICAPAFLLTVAILLLQPLSAVPNEQAVQASSFVAMVPYLAVIVAALAGLNVLAVLLIGIALGAIIGLWQGVFGLIGLMECLQTGMESMQNLAIVSMVIGGNVELMKVNGGIEWLLQVVRRRINSSKGAQFGIGTLVSAFTIATANNTVAIVAAGPLAKKLSTEHGIRPERSASLLDIFSSAWLGVLPYSGHTLTAAGLAAISPISIALHAYYPALIGLSAALAIALGWPSAQEKRKAECSTLASEKERYGQF